MLAEHTPIVKRSQTTCTVYPIIQPTGLEYITHAHLQCTCMFNKCLLANLYHYALNYVVIECL